MVFLITKTRGTRFGQLRQRAFLSRTLFYSKSYSARRFIKRNHALDRAVFAKHANLSRPKFRAALGIIDSTLLRVFAGPIRLYARGFKVLPAVPVRLNLDDRRALLHGISWVWHHAANEILGNHLESVTRRGLVLRHRRTSHQARITFLRR